MLGLTSFFSGPALTAGQGILQRGLMMTDPQAMFTDLATDGDEIDETVADLDDGEWQWGTPASGWAIAHQSAQRNRRRRSADLRSTSVCW
jgi:hypothetical protein